MLAIGANAKENVGAGLTTAVVQIGKESPLMELVAKSF